MFVVDNRKLWLGTPQAPKLSDTIVPSGSVQLTVTDEAPKTEGTSPPLVPEP